MVVASDFVKAKSKYSLLGHLKSAPDHATMMWRKDLLDAILTHDEVIEWSGEGGMSHGDLSDLLVDDHTQYLLADGTRELTGHWGTGGTYGVTELSHIDWLLTYAGAHQEGRMHWDADNGTVSVGMPGGVVELQLGQEHLCYANGWRV